jgi:hypothetical protein
VATSNITFRFFFFFIIMFIGKVSEEEKKENKKKTTVRSCCLTAEKSMSMIDVEQDEYRCMFYKHDDNLIVLGFSFARET